MSWDLIDGKPAAETITSAIDGVNYKIDVSKKNATALRESLAPWLAHARPVVVKRTRSFSTPTPVDARAVRAWAASNRILVSPRGRIAAQAIEQFRAAGN